MSTPAGVLALWLAVINVVTFAVYGADKRRARRGAWRVSEKTLFLLPLLGGSVGALAGMRPWEGARRSRGACTRRCCARTGS